MNPRASDVARLAHLSRSQVSNYFNNPDLVSADARERISAAIAELGYVRDEAASALRRGTTQMLGLLLLDGWAPYFAELAQAIDDEADRHGWYLQVANSSRDENREMRHLNYFEAYRTRGIIVAPQGNISARLQQLTERGMVWVLLDPPSGHSAPASIPSVAVDHVPVAHWPLSTSSSEAVTSSPSSATPPSCTARTDWPALPRPSDKAVPMHPSTSSRLLT